MHTQTSEQSVIVIRGGSRQTRRGHSLRSGSTVYHALRKHTDTHDVHLQPDGQMSYQGRKISKTDPFSTHGIIFNCLHNTAAGQLARLCKRFQKPHTGNTHLHRATYRRPHEARHSFNTNDVRTIPHWTFTSEDTSTHRKLYTAILKKITYPVVLFPLPKTHSGDSITVRSREDLVSALGSILPKQNRVHAQQGYAGSVYSVLALPHFRNRSPYVFPAFRRRTGNVANRPEEAITHTDFQPAASRKQQPLQNFARSAYDSTDLSCLTRIDILKTADSGLFLSHIEPHPRLDRHSLLAESTDRVGALLRDVFRAQITAARTEK